MNFNDQRTLETLPDQIAAFQNAGCGAECGPGWKTAWKSAPALGVNSIE
jgi:hypothetical protein